MPCANPVARSCVRPAANAVDAIVGLSRPPRSLIYSDFMGGLGGADPLLGYSLLGPQYQDGVLVGLHPACDDLAFAGLPGTRGMRTCGQVTNLNTTTLTGLASSGCSKVLNTGYMQLVDDVTNNSHQVHTSNISISSYVTYTACVDVKKDSKSFAHLQLNVSSGLAASFVGVDLNDASCSVVTLVGGLLNVTAYARNLSDGYTRIYMTFTVPSGRTVANMYIGPSQSKTVREYVGGGVSAIYIRDNITMYASPAILSPLPPGVTQTSTAHNGTSGIHYNMPQNGQIWNQLSTAKPLTLAARIVVGVGSAEIIVDGDVAIFSSAAVTNDDLYMDKYTAGRIVRATDKTSTALIVGEWARYEQLILCTQVNTAGTQFRVGVYRVAAKTWSWSSLVAYDGSFNPSAVYQKLMIAFSNNYPMWHIRHWLADYQASDSDILSAMGVAA